MNYACTIAHEFCSTSALGWFEEEALLIAIAVSHEA
jgi:hypothetical protein